MRVNARHQGNATDSFAAANLKISSAGPETSTPMGLKPVLAVAALVCIWLLVLGPSRVANAATCSGGTLFAQPLLTSGEAQPDLIVTGGECRVPPGDYFYRNVNIIHNGRLIFQEGAGRETNFWASSIIVESGGYL